MRVSIDHVTPAHVCRHGTRDGTQVTAQYGLKVRCRNASGACAAESRQSRPPRPSAKGTAPGMPPVELGADERGAGDGDADEQCAGDEGAGEHGAGERGAAVDRQVERGQRLRTQRARVSTVGVSG